MLLLVTTPASAMMPMPVITTPKPWCMTIRPMKTPMVESTIAESTRPTLDNLLHLRGARPIRKIAVPKAFARAGGPVRAHCPASDARRVDPFGVLNLPLDDVG